MHGDQIGNLVYLVLLLLAVGSWVFVQNRQSLGKTAQQLAIWAFIFIGVIAVIGLWEDVDNSLRPRQSSKTESGQITVPRQQDGHFYLTLEMNGVPLEVLVDTGASDLVLSLHDAQEIGLETETLAFWGRANTANGTVRTAPVRIDEIRLGSAVDRNVAAVVNEGAMEQTLLGMGYLQRYSSLEIRGDTLVLTR